MYRKDYWTVGHYADHIDKYECLECRNEFIVGRKMLEMSGREKPICPYCGCSLTDDQAGTDDERLEELADELGCLGLYFENEKEQRDWIDKELVKVQLKAPKGITDNDLSLIIGRALEGICTHNSSVQISKIAEEVDLICIMSRWDFAVAKYKGQ